MHTGILSISNCFSQVIDTDQDLKKWNKHNQNVISDEDLEDYSSGEYSDFEEHPHRRRNKTFPNYDATGQIYRNKIKQKNIKQKVVAILRRFRDNGEEEHASIGVDSSASRIKPLTELELQEIFEELDNISDSGPELEPDKMSIVSNPRPGIRPYFTSKSDIMSVVEMSVSRFFLKSLFIQYFYYFRFSHPQMTVFQALVRSRS